MKTLNFCSYMQCVVISKIGSLLDMSLPLIRIDDKQWLNEYRRGKVFLRNQLYYQSLDSSDSARSDMFDGAIPAMTSKYFDSISKRLPAGAEIGKSRIMNLNVFISCLFAFKEANVFRGNKDEIKLLLSEENKAAIKEFKKHSALIIFDRDEFERRVNESAKRHQIPCIVGNVEYCDLSDQETSEKLICESQERTQPAYKIPFIKDFQFAPQQEYRICCEFKRSIADPTQQDMFYLSDAVKNQYRLLETISLEDISLILPLDFVLNRNILINRTGIEFITD